MSAKAPKSWAFRWKSTSRFASELCANAPTPWAFAARCETWSRRRLDRAVRVEDKRSAEQHARKDERNDAGGKPFGVESRARGKVFGLALTVFGRGDRVRFLLLHRLRGG